MHHISQVRRLLGGSWHVLHSKYYCNILVEGTQHMLSDETPIFVCWNTLLYKLTLIRRHNIPIRNSVLQTFAYSLSKSNKDLAVYIPIEMIAFGDSIYFDEGSLSTLSEKVRRIGRNQEERRQTQPNSLSIYTNMRTKRYIFYNNVCTYFVPLCSEILPRFNFAKARNSSHGPNYDELFTNQKPWIRYFLVCHLF